ncbi:Crp/Fnr family transcriptional regulator [Ideonella livida]|uniref:Crp/Fnr family transcriptional regulator n=1 Tax=Ideonella livida TaxID=2707176 RepID=A0A7C9TIF9_9BURK|nr:Crp/Fnr family transcriptional regulator [Ideonella livida]NDY91261.1 Crp/Fnr family transcriptional regulator [Ideonella livida]
MSWNPHFTTPAAGGTPVNGRVPVTTWAPTGGYGRTAMRPEPALHLHEERAVVQNPWFQELGADLQRALMAACSVRRVRAGTTLLRSNLRAESWYGLALGVVRLSVPLDNGRHLTLSLVRPGEWFGDVSMLDERSPWEAEALTDVTLLWMPRAALLDLLERFPAFGLALARLNSTRTRQLTQLLAGAVSQPLRQRVAQLLVYVGKRFGVPHAAGTRVTLKLSQRDLADMLGVCRQRVNVCLKRMERESLVQVDDGHLVLQLTGLRTVVTSPPDAS